MEATDNETVYAVRKDVSGEGSVTPGQSISDTFQTRLQGLYCQDDTAGKEKDFMKLAKEGNNSGSKDKEKEHRPQKKAVYAVKKACQMGEFYRGRWKVLIFMLNYRVYMNNLNSLI